MPVEQLNDTLVATTRAMASAITIQMPRTSTDVARPERLLDQALDVFHQVHDICTRFDPQSPLMRTNASPTRRHRVPRVLFDALQEAYTAYERTHGVFDPRVVRHLESMGYDSSLSFDQTDIQVGERDEPAPLRRTWQPRFRASKCDVWIGEPVDLGGIGKGLAVRWASDVLAPHTQDYLVEAGGDCYLAGRAPDGDSWRVGVEDPFGGETPVAVLAVSDRAVATSSTRLRHWRVGERPVHHLIDPRTGKSGGEGLIAVTVVGHDPAVAEVDTKVLFLSGRDAIAREAARHEMAALWCDTEGQVHCSEAMAPYVIWERT